MGSFEVYVSAIGLFILVVCVVITSCFKAVAKVFWLVSFAPLGISLFLGIAGGVVSWYGFLFIIFVELCFMESLFNKCELGPQMTVVCNMIFQLKYFLLHLDKAKKSSCVFSPLLPVL